MRLYIWHRTMPRGPRSVQGPENTYPKKRLYPARWLMRFPPSVLEEQFLPAIHSPPQTLRAPATHVGQVDGDIPSSVRSCRQARAKFIQQPPSLQSVFVVEQLRNPQLDFHRNLRPYQRRRRTSYWSTSFDVRAVGICAFLIFPLFSLVPYSMVTR